MAIGMEFGKKINGDKFFSICSAGDRSIVIVGRAQRSYRSGYPVRYQLAALWAGIIDLRRLAAAEYIYRTGVRILPCYTTADHI
jgi:hypothetical protein